MGNCCEFLCCIACGALRVLCMSLCAACVADSCIVFLHGPLSISLVATLCQVLYLGGRSGHVLQKVAKPLPVYLLQNRSPHQLQSKPSTNCARLPPPTVEQVPPSTAEHNPSPISVQMLHQLRSKATPQLRSKSPHQLRSQSPRDALG